MANIWLQVKYIQNPETYVVRFGELNLSWNFNQSGQKLYAARVFEENTNLTMTMCRFSWPGDLALSHIDLKILENVYI